MKKWISVIMLGLMVVIGVFLIYQEATARPSTCLEVQAWCNACGGSLYLHYLGMSNGQEYYHFDCYYGEYISGTCEGPL